MARKLFMHINFWADWRTIENVGIMMLNKIAMIASVIISSMRLKPAAIGNGRVADRKDSEGVFFIRDGL